MYLRNEQLIVPPIAYKGLEKNMLLMLNQLDFLCSSTKIEHPYLHRYLKCDYSKSGTS